MFEAMLSLVVLGFLFLTAYLKGQIVTLKHKLRDAENKTPKVIEFIKNEPTILGDRLTYEGIADWLEKSASNPLDLDLTDLKSAKQLAQLIRQGEYIPYAEQLIEVTKARVKRDTELLKGIGHEPVLVKEAEKVRRNTGRGKSFGGRDKSCRGSYNEKSRNDIVLERIGISHGISECEYYNHEYL